MGVSFLARGLKICFNNRLNFPKNVQHCKIFWNINQRNVSRKEASKPLNFLFYFIIRFNTQNHNVCKSQELPQYGRCTRFKFIENMTSKLSAISCSLKTDWASFRTHSHLWCLSDIIYSDATASLLQQGLWIVGYLRKISWL